MTIDEHSVIGQNMFAWIDKHLDQVKCKPDAQSGCISIVLVGDFVQLPQVRDKPLYHSIHSSNQLMGYMGYRSVTIVVKLI